VRACPLDDVVEDAVDVGVDLVLDGAVEERGRGEPVADELGEVLEVRAPVSVAVAASLVGELLDGADQLALLEPEVGEQIVGGDALGRRDVNERLARLQLRLEVLGAEAERRRSPGTSPRESSENRGVRAWPSNRSAIPSIVSCP
jgi:hypothetical protein